MKPDVLLLDIIMPYMDGIEVVIRYNIIFELHSGTLLLLSYSTPDKGALRSLDLLPCF